MREWQQADIRRLIDAALDGFTVEFLDASAFSRLSHEDKRKVLRAIRDDINGRHAYEWMMRCVK